MNFFAVSDKGKVRKINQDSYGGFVADSGLGFFIVADGMGGHNAGEVASAVAVDAFVKGAENNHGIKTIEKAAEFIRNTFHRANDIILYKAAADVTKIGMGTTAVAAVVADDKIIIGNLGDSRAYFISGYKIKQITEDHSYVGQLLKAGSIKEEEARVHPRRNEITRALGIESYFEPDMFEIEYKAGDVLLLCSDGLDKMVEDSKILEIVLKEKEPKDLCQQLIDAANDEGGMDNITALAVVL